MKKGFYCLLLLPLFASIFSCNNSGANNQSNEASAKAVDNSGLKLPAGFHATIFADSLGRARHIAVSPKGVVYVKLNSVHDNHTILRLTDTNGDGVADNIFGFATYKGTGMAIKNGFLYASSDENIYRYPLNSNDEADTAKEELLVSGLINRHMHEAKAITLDNAGNIYVNVGAYSNACQSVDRTKGSVGMQPCPILDSAGGIWTFKADKPNQIAYKDGEHYATGLRNVVGLDWNNVTNSLFVMQHGRDQLHDLYPQYFDTKQSAELPAECMYELHQGADAGWPYMYYDQIQHKKILAPEYGGDGKKTGGEKAIDPAAAYPGHMAPDGLLFYTGNQFPEKYKNGAFIAFHGSWNRAPEPQKGYFVVFQPFKDGKPNGDWEIFADNFAGIDSIADPGKAAHRPCGLAQGPDGALYVTDDVKGRVYKISYSKK